MKIHKITLSNFRAHKFFEFEPVLDGMTTLRGVNGVGKSTILDALSWSLYGVKPDGVSKNAALVNRYSAAPKTEDCFVESLFSLGDSMYKVRRSIVNNAGKITCRLYFIKEDGTEERIAGDSPTSTDPEIRKLLKMTKDEFFAAVHVQQKKVDALVDSSSKSSRANVIQKLIGVSGLTESIKVANDALRSEKKSISLSSFNGETLEHSRRELERLVVALDKLKDKELVLKERVEKGVGVAKERKQFYENKNRDFLSVQSAQSQLDVLEPSVVQDQQEINELTQQRSVLKRKVASVENSAGDFKAIRQELSDKEKKHKDCSRRLVQQESLLEKLRQDKQTALEVVKESSFPDKDACEKAIADTTSDVEQLQNAVSECLDRQASLTSRAKEAKNAILVINSGQCPTCLQEVHDKEESIRQLENSVDQFREQYKVTQKTVTETKEAIVLKESSLEGARMASAAFESLETIGQQESETERSVQELRRSESYLSADVESQRNIFYAAQEIENIKTEYKKVRERLLSVTDRVDKNSAKIRKIKNSIAELPKVTESSVEKSKQAAEKADSLLLSLRDSLNECSTEIRVTERDIENTNENIKRETENSKNYANLLSNAERLSASVETLSEFKQNRIDHAIPAVEAFASTLLSSFTDNVLSSVALDDNFMVTVSKADGEEFSVGELSGGEESVVAIALRVAISMMLASGTEGFPLILDEVLFSLDTNRTPKVLQGIKNIHGGQVIIIDHKNDVVDEVVDKVVSL